MASSQIVGVEVLDVTSLSFNSMKSEAFVLVILCVTTCLTPERVRRGSLTHTGTVGHLRASYVSRALYVPAMRETFKPVPTPFLGNKVSAPNPHLTRTDAELKQFHDKFSVFKHFTCL